MPTVLGPGKYNSLEWDDNKEKPKNVEAVDSQKGLNAHAVPWGYYYYNNGNERTRVMGTEALNSCIAVICNYNRGEKVFFAHVSNDGEADHVVTAIKRVNPERSAAYTCILVLGVNPQKTTLRRANKIMKAANYGFHVFQSKQGAVSYDSVTGELDFGARVLAVYEKTKAAMGFGHDKLDPMEGSLDLDNN